jgi:hypothetical protein
VDRGRHQIASKPIACRNQRTRLRLIRIPYSRSGTG